MLHVEHIFALLLLCVLLHVEQLTLLYVQYCYDIDEQITNKIKLVFGRPEIGRNGDFVWAGCLLSGYVLACFDVRFPYENVGVSAELRFLILE